MSLDRMLFKLFDRVGETGTRCQPVSWLARDCMFKRNTAPELRRLDEELSIVLSASAIIRRELSKDI